MDCWWSDLKSAEPRDESRETPRGLLHDIGKVVLSQYFHDVFQRVWKRTQTEGLSFSESEKKEGVIGHDLIGGYLARSQKGGIMNDHRHTVLCVDDEPNILNSLRRLLRREGYRLFTASSGKTGLNILKEHQVNLVISDQRMPEMNGTEFLARVKEEHPDVFCIILTGYTDIDSITDSINKGNVYKFFMKPWNDQNLKLEIRQALDQYDLIQDNRKLHETILEQNEVLKQTNENLEKMVQERTRDLEIQNHALELSRIILEDLPLPILGISSEETIVLINALAQSLSFNGKGIKIGKRLSEYFPDNVRKTMRRVIESDTPSTLLGYHLSEKTYDLDLRPLSGRFRGKGIILAIKSIR
jgi:FixJ family two-component response regulator